MRCIWAQKFALWFQTFNKRHCLTGWSQISRYPVKRVQTYSAVFDASIETVPQNQPKGRSLTFELTAEGNLPHVVVAKPTLRNKRGQPLLVFQRCLLGRAHTLPVVIVNDGTMTCKVSHVFTIYCNAVQNDGCRAYAECWCCMCRSRLN